nr:heavy metal-binding domain-containing protein [Methylomarinum sp. Ch1-1]MDP4520762.1 heavy metal-binding domain-containing protein [Methylomarinum sp. Ch1-1]
MIVTTSETIPDQSVAEILGVVSGNVVQSRTYR